MGEKIIYLSRYKGYKEYNKIISELHRKLGDLASELFDESVQLAMSGKWRDWSGEQTTGSRIRLDDKMLRETRDPNIGILLELSDYIINLNKRLKPKPGSQLKKATVKLQKEAKEEEKNSHGGYKLSGTIEYMRPRGVDLFPLGYKLNGTIEYICPLCHRDLRPNYSSNFLHEYALMYLGLICKSCAKKAVNSEGLSPEHHSIYDNGDNPVFIDNRKCWRRYKFGGFVTRLDPDDCSSLAEFHKHQSARQKKIYGIINQRDERFQEYLPMGNGGDKEAGPR